MTEAAATLDRVMRLDRGRLLAALATRTGDLQRAEAQIAALGPELQSYQPYHAARAALLCRLGRQAEAALAYDHAIALTTRAADAAFLRKARQDMLP